MKKDFFEGIEVKRGGISDINNFVGGFDLPHFDPDKIFLNGNEICTFNMDSFRVKFKDDEAREMFRRHAKESGIVPMLKEKFNQEKITENIAVAAAFDPSLNILSDYYESRKEKKRTLTGIIGEFLKSEDNKQYEKLVEHRNGLKEENIKKSEEIDEFDVAINALKKETEINEINIDKRDKSIKNKYK